MTKIVAVTNNKGGVGKTTSALSLAAIGAREGLRVLVIDTDTNKTGSAMSRVTYDSDAETAAALFWEKPVLPSKLAKPTIFSYDAIPAGANLKAAELQLVMRAVGGKTDFRQLLENDEGLSKYDLVFIDTSAHTTSILSAVLMACTHVILPICPSKMNLHALRDFLPLLVRMNEERAMYKFPKFDVLGIVWVKVTARRSTERRAISEVAEQLKGNALFPISPIEIPDSNGVLEAEERDAPVTVARPRDTAAKKYEELYNAFFGGPAAKRAANK